MIPTIAVLGVTVLTLGLGTIGLRFARTTSNFFVASRSVHPVWNAFAVSGEAMSAASYLGLPALVMVFGVDLLWSLIGWTVGFLMLSLFIAAPMRRSGAYTIPEFVESRLDAPGLRPVVAVVVIVVTWFFLLAQLKGAGVVVRELVGTPYWVGVAAVGVLVATNLSAGGMRGITFVQGFQFFFIFLGILVPFVVVSALWFQDETEPIVTDGFPAFIEDTTATYANATSIEVTEATRAVVDGTLDGERLASGTVVLLDPGIYEVGADAEITWPAGAAVPFSVDIQRLRGIEWVEPDGDKDLAGGHPRYFAIASLISQAFGIMGMPHIVVRFYTNPNGREARRTSVWFMLMIVPYYAMLPLLGANARNAGPELFSTGATDSATVSIGGLVGGAGADWITAAVSAGAAAAFLSTSSGLLIAMAGAFSHDIRAAGVPQFRRAIWVGALVSIGAALLVESINISSLIGWSSTIAAASLAPLMLLGIWWTGLTRRGTIAMLAVGGGVATITGLLGLFGLVGDGWMGALLGQPSIWIVPLAFATAIVVSRRDRIKVGDLGHKFALMHLPERAGTPS
ncbi:MAG: cation acetate symporter [Actinomycetota bacterium]